jgi:putative membrane protein
MADPIINDLLEEAAQRCQELTEAANEASARVDELVASTGALEDRLAEGAEDAHGAFREAAAVLAAVGTELRTLETQVPDAFERLGEQAGAVEDVAEGVAPAVEGETTRLEQQQQRVAAALEARTDRLEAEAQALAERVVRAQAETVERLEEAGRSVDALRASLDSAHQGMAEAQAALLDRWSAGQEALAGQVTACAGAIGDGLDAAADALVEAANRMLNAHNQAVVTVRQKLTEEAPAALSPAFEPVRAAIFELTELCSAEGVDLEGRAQDILGRVQEALGAVSRILPVLNLAGRLG